MNRTPVLYLIFLAATIMLAGCATGSAYIGQFQGFAKAGTAFADTVPQVLDQSFATTVTTDSLILKETRQSLTPAERLNGITQSTQSLERRLAILDDLRRHANVLRSYFVALQALAETDTESTGLTQVTQGLVAELGKLHPPIANARFGAATVSDLIAPAVKFSVIAYQSGVLKRELERHAETIQAELSLQEAALRAIAEAMKADLEAQFTAQDRDQIVLSYARDGTLPAGWARLRIESLKRRIQLRSVDASVTAITSLRTSYIALVEGKLGSAGLTTLIADVNEFVGFVKRMKNPGKS